MKKLTGRFTSAPNNTELIIIGEIVAIIPGAGGNIANLVAYNEAKRASRYPERFGSGIIEGLVASESCNKRVIVTALLFFVWGGAIGYLGFFVSSVLAILAQAWYLALARRKVTLPALALWLVVAAGEVAFFYLIFTRLLHVPLPEGILI